MIWQNFLSVDSVLVIWQICLDVEERASDLAELLEPVIWQNCVSVDSVPVIWQNCLYVEDYASVWHFWQNCLDVCGVGCQKKYSVFFPPQFTTIFFHHMQVSPDVCGVRCSVH